MTVRELLEKIEARRRFGDHCPRNGHGVEFEETVQHATLHGYLWNYIQNGIDCIAPSKKGYELLDP